MKSALSQLGFTIKKMGPSDLLAVRLLLAEIDETEERLGRWPKDLEVFLSAEQSAGVTVWYDGELTGACLFIGNDEQALDITVVAAAFDCCAMDNLFQCGVLPLMLATLMADTRDRPRMVRFQTSDFCVSDELSEGENALLAAMGRPHHSMDWRS